MRTLLFLLFLPLLMFPQFNGLHEKDFFHVEFSFDFDPSSMNSNIVDTVEGTVEIMVTVEVFFADVVRQRTVPETYVPKHLNTLSLVGMYPSTPMKNTPQERLNTLIASNDMNNPIERTPLDWLSPVQYQKMNLDNIHNIAEGFGPRFRL